MTDSSDPDCQEVPGQAGHGPTPLMTQRSNVSGVHHLVETTCVAGENTKLLFFKYNSDNFVTIFDGRDLKTRIWPAGCSSPGFGLTAVVMATRTLRNLPWSNFPAEPLPCLHSHRRGNREVT